MDLRHTFVTIGGVLAIALGGSSAAAPVAYTDPGDFLTQAWAGGSPATVNFDGVAHGTSIADGGTFGELTFSYPVLDGFGVAMNVVADAVNVSDGNVLGTDDLGVFQGGDVFDIAFAASNAIGMYFIADSGGAGMLDQDIVLTVGGFSVSLKVADLVDTLDSAGDSDPNGLFDVFFLGIVNPMSTFTSASVTTSGPFFTYTLDNIYTGKFSTVFSTPEPATLLLLGIGFVGIAVARARVPPGVDALPGVIDT